jgi:hypothetical protein
MLRMHYVVLGLALSFSSASMGGDAKDDGLQGTWVPASAQIAGKDFPDESASRSSS